MSALIIRAHFDTLVLPTLVDLGIDAEMVWDPTVALMARIREGEKADGIVAIDWAIDELTQRGRIASGSRRRLAQAAFGIAVRAGDAMPDISSADRLRQTLLAVPTLVYSRTGASGIFFERIIDQLGIGEEVRKKAIVLPAGLTAELVARGEAALAVQQVSELLAVEGVDLVGPFPEEVQENTDFSTAIFADAADPVGAQTVLDQLYTPRLRAAYLATGLAPFFE